MRVLLVYGYEPSGHASAARALEAAARAQGHEPVCVDVSAEHHPILGPALAKAYLALIQTVPALWGLLHESEAVAEVTRHWRQAYRALEGGKLKARLAELKPDLIVCTHAPPFGALALEKESGGLPCPLAAVITDFRAHPYWIAGGDLYIASTPESAADLARRGVAPGSVRVCGIPIDPSFARPLPREEARRRLGLKSGPVLLVSGGSRGLGRLPATARLLSRSLPEAQILALCGSNQELFEELLEQDLPGVRPLPQAAPGRMRELLAAADLLVGKAGGLTAAEALACGTPMLIVDPIAGQEEANARWLEASGVGVWVKDINELPAAAVQTLKRLPELQAKARELGRPDASVAGLQAALALCAATA